MKSILKGLIGALALAVAGSALASFCVEDVGPSRLLSMTGHDLRARLGAFKSLVHVEHELDALQLLR